MISNLSYTIFLDLDDLPSPLIAIDSAGFILKVNRAAQSKFQGMDAGESKSIERFFTRRIGGKKAHLWNLLRGMEPSEQLTRERYLTIDGSSIPLKLTIKRIQEGFLCFPERIENRFIDQISETLKKYDKTLGVMKLIFENDSIQTSFYTESFVRNLLDQPDAPLNGNTLFDSLLKQMRPEDRIKITQFQTKPDTFMNFYMECSRTSGIKTPIKVYLIKESYNPRHVLVLLLNSEDGFRKAIEEKLLAQHTAQSFHDINQPLFRMKLILIEFAEWLNGGAKTGPDSEQRLRGFIKDLEEEHISATWISGKVEDSFRMSQGRFSLDVSRINLKTLFESLSHSFQRHANNNHIAFESHLNINFDEDVLADDAKIRRMVSNLVNNSIKFTERFRREDGKVILTVSATKISKTNQVLVRISVEDNGPGIPENKISALFSPGIQLQNVVDGSGLGLSIVKSFGLEMGGDIHLVKTEVGVGTTFVLEFFVGSTDCSPPISKKKTVNISHHKGLRALIADDNKANVALLKRLLERMGYIVSTASDGQEAIDLLTQSLSETRFDFAIFDKEMKSKNREALDGDEATALWRKIEEAREKGERLPIFALTGSNTAEAFKSLMAAGMDAVIQKINPTEHKERIYALVQEHVIDKRGNNDN